MSRAGAVLAIIAVGALTGCQVLQDVQLSPADGAVTYVREICQVPASERAALLAEMDTATAPNRLTVSCAP